MGIRERSGSVNSNDKAVLFFYLLMRDHLPSGVVEEIMKDVEESAKKGETQFCNGYLAQHAQDVAERLKDGSTKAQENE